MAGHSVGGLSNCAAVVGRDLSNLLNELERHLKTYSALFPNEAGSWRFRSIQLMSTNCAAATAFFIKLVARCSCSFRRASSTDSWAPQHADSAENPVL